MTTFRGIQFEVAGTPHPVPAAELEAVERQLRCTFPDDYRTFVLQFGPGEFRDLCFKVMSPSAIARTTWTDRSRLREHWFWDASPEIWTQEQAAAAIACFDGEGDDIRFHPSNPSEMYFLPHEENVIFRAESLAELLDVTRRYCGLSPRALTFLPRGAEPDGSPNAGPARPLGVSGVTGGAHR